MLTILETAAQVEWYSKNHSPRSSDGSVLAITPTAAYACQQLSLSYLKLEDHCRYAQRFTEYSDALQEYLEWETWLDDWSQDAIREFKESGFRPAKAVTFLLQLLLAEIWATTCNLREFLGSTKPDRVAFWSPRLIEVPWFLQPQISPANVLLPDLISPVLDFVELSHELPELSPESYEADVEAPAAARLKNWLKKSLRQSNIFTELDALRNFGPSIILSALKTGRPRVLATGVGYDLEPLILELRRRGVAVMRLKDNTPVAFANGNRDSVGADMRQRLNDAGDRLLTESALWDPLKRWGVGRTPLLSRPLKYWWDNLVPVLWSRYQQTTHLLKRKKHDALITTDCGATTWGGPDCEAAFTSGVPRWCLQHGGSTGADSKIWQMYLRASETFLVAGDGTVQELEQNRPSFLRGCGSFTPVGSSRLDQLRRQSSSQENLELRRALHLGDPRPIVLYVPNSFGTYGRAISDLAAFPEVSYMELQQDVLRLWNDFTQVRLLYKELIVANDPNRVMSSFVREHIPNGTVTNQRLTDLMWAVDAIIVDHPITALGEVLLTKKRVVAYMPKPNASHPEAKLLLEKRAIVAETPAGFIDAVSSFLAAGEFSELTESDDQFLRWYCTHGDDGRSAERAANAILDTLPVARRELGHEITG